MSVKRHLSKPKPIKLLLLCLVPIAAAHNAAVGQNVNRGSPKPVRVVSIRFAQWAGMCYGYCSEDLELAEIIRSRRWSVDVGIANAISKPGVSQASSAGQSRWSCTDQDRWPICFVLGEHGPGDARQLIR